MNICVSDKKSFFNNEFEADLYTIYKSTITVHHVNVKEKVSRPSTGCKSEIWKKVQLNIYLIYTASMEKNDTLVKSPGIQLENDTLKVIISLKLTFREIIEGKKSKNP